MSISVIIPAYQDTVRLKKCLAALKNQTVSQDIFDVIVINNDSEERLQLQNTAHNVRIVHEDNPGSYSARNLGIANSSAPFLAFTDSDCVPDPDWIRNGITLLEAHPGARITGPVAMFQEKAYGYYSYLYEHQFAFKQKENAANGECVTANLMASRQAFHQVGLFDSNLLSGGDREWNRRAQQAGIPLIYDDGVVVRHPARSLRGLFAKRKRTSRSEALMLKNSTFRYIRWRLRPPFDDRFRLTRGEVSSSETAVLFLMMWSLNIYGACQFALVRWGLVRPVRQ